MIGARGLTHIILFSSDDDEIGRNECCCCLWNTYYSRGAISIKFFSIQFVLCLILKSIIVSPGHILPETGTETEGV